MSTNITENNINVLLYKIKNLVYFDTLFALEEDFNKTGLSVQLSGGNRVILCKIIGGKAKASVAMEDYIFLGPFAYAEAKQEISGRLISSISDFVMNHAGSPDKIENLPRLWQQGVKTYGQVIRIIDEDIQEIAQSING
jgi:predicted histidine transporter YuiF (NhaC family)